MIDIKRYILLKSKSELDKETIRKWYRCVRNNAPSGVVVTIQSKDDSSPITLICREIEDTYNYIVPLSRDLNNREIESIVDKFATTTDIDFQIETSETFFATTEEQPIVLNSDSYLELCNRIAKKKHQDWLKERINSGWSYGTEFNEKSKTHPLLVAWDRLPDELKKPDVELPQMVIDELSNSGYSIVSKEELEKISKLLRTKQ